MYKLITLRSFARQISSSIHTDKSEQKYINKSNYMSDRFYAENKYNIYFAIT
ncbi:11240_t:CDS:2 [Funneliformis caledonium]|uniref:11240_t:CDS:1 n=1 Tax=Funneliformis caledonium TaxID=1117310 RepID=A0A9N8VBN8_9GLOM|nr:11240_t:CDS:2 [Funneliformis caledonium]